MQYNCGPKKPLRLGQVIELKEECVAEYTVRGINNRPLKTLELSCMRTK